VAGRLARTADVVIESFRPGVMERIGLGHDQLLQVQPRLVYCSLPGFGTTDPRADLPGWEGIVSAAAGVYTPSPAEVSMQANAEPSFNALTICSNFAAMVAANCVVAALIARQRRGFGQWIEVPLFDACFEAIGSQAQRLEFEPPPPQIFHQSAAGAYRCADDRWIYILMLTPRHLRWLVNGLLGEQDLPPGMDDHFRLVSDRDLSAALHERLVRLFASRPASHWDGAINALGVPCCLVRSTAEFLRDDDDAREVRAVIELEDPELGPTLQAGYPVQMGATPPAARRPRSKPDADREAILAELSVLESGSTGKPREIHPPSSGPNVPHGEQRGALDGVRVVDASQVYAGPSAGRILAEMGAEVIKINPPTGLNIGHLYTNSGKRSALIDLKADEGLQILWLLLCQGRVAICGFHPVHGMRPGAPTAVRCELSVVGPVRSGSAE